MKKNKTKAKVAPAQIGQYTYDVQRFTPLRVEQNEWWNWCIWTRKNDTEGTFNNFVLAECQNRSDAQFIVRACNSHAALVEALQTMVRRVERDNLHRTKRWDLTNARAALALATAIGKGAS